MSPKPLWQASWFAERIEQMSNPPGKTWHMNLADSEFTMICHLCGQEWHHGHECPTDIIDGTWRDADPVPLLLLPARTGDTNE